MVLKPKKGDIGLLPKLGSILYRNFAQSYTDIWFSFIPILFGSVFYRNLVQSYSEIWFEIIRKFSLVLYRNLVWSYTEI